MFTELIFHPDYKCIFYLTWTHFLTHVMPAADTSNSFLAGQFCSLIRIKISGILFLFLTLVKLIIKYLLWIDSVCLFEKLLVVAKFIDIPRQLVKVDDDTT